jgi:dihydrofolate synthase/folylpolyglutamate synthase
VTADIFDWLFSLGQFGIKFGLHGTHAVLRGLGDPQRQFRSVHVAGTNGKGSVTAMAETALRSAGYKTGRYTSPHLLDLTERFAIDGRPAPIDAARASLERVRDVVETLTANGTLEVSPTFFEVTTAAAFDLFRAAGVEVAVCEVGLGGRLDATNVLEPIACAVTSIAFDHEQHLGHTLPQIAREKAGIIKRGTPVVIGAVGHEVRTVFEEAATATGAPLLWAHDGVTVGPVATTDRGQSFALTTPTCNYGQVTLRLLGDHQVDNAVVAVRLLEVLASRGIACPPRQIADALANVSWPGRLQQVRLAGGRTLLLDAAHNAAGASALARYLTHLGGRRPLVFAAMKDKNAKAMLEGLLPRASAVIVTRASNPRSDEPEVLAATARAVRADIPVEVANTAERALGQAWTHGPDVIVAGSIFLLADVLRLLERT